MSYHEGPVISFVTWCIQHLGSAPCSATFYFDPIISHISPVNPFYSSICLWKYKPTSGNQPPSLLSPLTISYLKALNFRSAHVSTHFVFYKIS